MEQACYKCGQAVEEGVPFCPHCSAPQIRVVIAEPPAVPAPVAEASATPHGPSPLPASQTVPVLALPIQWSRAVVPCALAALVGSLLMSLGLYPLVAVPSAGFLAVIFYRQRQRGVVVKGPAGARLGALGGLFCFGLPALVAAFAAAIPDLRMKMREQVIENFQKAAATRQGDPQVQALLNQLKTPEGLAMILLLLGILGLALSIALGSLGGILGSLLGRRDRP